MHEDSSHVTKPSVDSIIVKFTKRSRLRWFISPQNQGMAAVIPCNNKLTLQSQRAWLKQRSGGTEGSVGRTSVVEYNSLCLTFIFNLHLYFLPSNHVLKKIKLFNSSTSEHGEEHRGPRPRQSFTFTFEGHGTFCRRSIKPYDKHCCSSFMLKVATNVNGFYAMRINVNDSIM